MNRTHLLVFIGAAVVGYVFASSLADKQPFKFASGLVADL